MLSGMGSSMNSPEGSGPVNYDLARQLASSSIGFVAPVPERLQTTDGNLSVHLRKLEEAGFVAVSKSFQGRKPLTRASMTEIGRDAFLTYLDAMSALVAGR